MKKTFLYQKGNQIQSGDACIFKELTGADLITEMVGSYTPLSPSIGEKHVSNWLLPHYLHYIKNPPKLILKLGKMKGQHALLAGETIKKNDIVTEYLGEWSLTSHSPYKFGPIEGLTSRNLAAQIDDGFPNLGAFYLYDTKGPLRILFLALEDINEGDLLNISYATSHSIKLQERQEFRKEEMCAYFKKNPLSTLISYLKPLTYSSVQSLTKETYFDFEAVLNRLQYPFHTPKALSILLEEKIFNKEEAKIFFNKLDHRLYLLNFPLSLNPTQQKIYDEISDLLH